MAVAVNDNVLTAVRRDANGMLAEKTPARLEAYLREAGLDASSDTTLNGTRLPSLSHVLEHCLESAGRLPVVPGILHGDLCFSNILYDTRADRIKIIDPRGLNYLEELSLVGDLRYDLAKLSHSVLGLYDFIIGDAFEVDNGHGLDFQFNIHADDNIRQIQKTFEALPLVGDLTARDVAPITIMLFLSMLPLHRDTPRRQRAMLANALRLFSEMDH